MGPREFPGSSPMPEPWTANFNNTIHSYIIGKKRFSIRGVLQRFEKQARNVHGP